MDEHCQTIVNAGELSTEARRFSPNLALIRSSEGSGATRRCEAG